MISDSTQLESGYENYCSYLKHTALLVCEYIYNLAQRIVEMLISKFLFMGYKEVPQEIARERTQALINNKGAYHLACQNNQGKNIDILYVPSSSPKKTGNAVVLALNTTYQDHHPKHYEHYLANGADIVLWNQTALNCNQYAQDLSLVLKTVKTQSPDQKLCIKSYCQSVEPSIAAAAELNDPNISIIADRGHGNVFKLAESQTILAKLPCIQKILREKFSCDGMQKLKSIPGPMAFVAPPANDDQCMQYAWGKRNFFTHDLFNERQKNEDTTSSCTAEGTIG